MARRSLPPLNQLRAFEAAARHTSFTRAAGELHVTQGAISRHVRALEDILGLELFDRTPTGVTLRREGATYAHALTDALDRMAHATRALLDERPRSTITVQGFTTLMMRWLIPRLSGLQAACPELEVRLRTSPHPADFRRDRVDMAILYGAGVWPGLRADLLFCDDLLPVCAPAYVARHGLPASTEALGAHHLLHHTPRGEDWPDWLALAGYPMLRPASASAFADLSVAYECMASGLGIALGQRAYFERALADGSVIAPFPTALRRDKGYYLVCPGDQCDTPPIARFRDWLLSTL